MFSSLMEQEPAYDKVALQQEIVDHIKHTLGRTVKTIDAFGVYQATAASLRARMIDRWNRTQEAYESSGCRQIAYISLEFLLGRAMTNALYNMGLTGQYADSLRDLGFTLESVQAEEADAALGNGGLGRLAACFIASSASLNMPVTGYGLRYQYGMFKQSLQDGFQVESPEYWLRRGCPYEVAREDIQYNVRFGGHTSFTTNADDGRPQFLWEGGEIVHAVAHDMLIPGYATINVANIRLWSARPTDEFRLHEHTRGDFFAAVRSKAETENLTYVLYPNDNNYDGKVLRLKQEYFCVSATLQDMIARAIALGIPLSKLHERFGAQMNDTHPTLGVPELMRLLLDDYHMEWDEAWEVTKQFFAYTNHTVLPEALEKWPVSILEQVLPRHLQIIYEINARFIKMLQEQYPGDIELIRETSVIQEGNQRQVRMANLAIIGSHHVNGVAALHTEIIKRDIFPGFYRIWPEKFVNMTNGVTPRRWIAQCNPGLRKFITKHLIKLGKIRSERDWPKDLDRLRHLIQLGSDAGALDELMQVKLVNKRRLAAYIKEACDVELDPERMLFDIQVKRIHEYKRQLLNILGVVARYLELKQLTPEELVEMNVVPRAHIIAGKAACGYDVAKRIIKLVNSVAAVINADPATSQYLKLVFIPNYCVSNAELIFPGADVSQQVSTAGMEASGTGCIKSCMNGALLMGTLDGANIELREAIGAENMITFGAETEEINAVRAAYARGEREELHPALIAVLDAIDAGMFGMPAYFQAVTAPIRSGCDWFCVAHDFEAYLEAVGVADDLYRSPSEWAAACLANIALTAHFSSDRTIKQYAETIWNIEPCAVAAEKASFRSGAAPIPLPVVKEVRGRVGSSLLSH
jgi:starch phosphorylase